MRNSVWFVEGFVSSHYIGGWGSQLQFLGIVGRTKTTARSREAAVQRPEVSRIIQVDLATNFDKTSGATIVLLPRDISAIV